MFSIKLLNAVLFNKELQKWNNLCIQLKYISYIIG